MPRDSLRAKKSVRWSSSTTWPGLTTVCPQSPPSSHSGASSKHVDIHDHHHLSLCIARKYWRVYGCFCVCVCVCVYMCMCMCIWERQSVGCVNLQQGNGEQASNLAWMERLFKLIIWQNTIFCDQELVLGELELTSALTLLTTMLSPKKKSTFSRLSGACVKNAASWSRL